MSSRILVARRRQASVLVVAILSVVVGCGAQANFKSNTVDAGRLALLHADAILSSLQSRPAGASLTCSDDIARYQASSGEPLDFGGVRDNAVSCAVSYNAAGVATPSAVRMLIVVVLSEASPDGWQPADELGNLDFRKLFGKVWAKLTVSAIGAQILVDLSMPPHTSDGFSPGPSERSSGQACLVTVLREGGTPTRC